VELSNKMIAAAARSFLVMLSDGASLQENARMSNERETRDLTVIQHPASSALQLRSSQLYLTALKMDTTGDNPRRVVHKHGCQKLATS